MRSRIFHMFGPKIFQWIEFIKYLINVIKKIPRMYNIERIIWYSIWSGKWVASYLLQLSYGHFISLTIWNLYEHCNSELGYDFRKMDRYIPTENEYYNKIIYIRYVYNCKINIKQCMSPPRLELLLISYNRFPSKRMASYMNLEY